MEDLVCSTFARGLTAVVVVRHIIRGDPCPNPEKEILSVAAGKDGLLRTVSRLMYDAP